MKPSGFLLASLLATAPALAGADDDAKGHLLAGARAFRAERYDEALIEFRVALQRGAAPQAHWYVAATLQKSGRDEEALVAFLVAEAAAPRARDAVLTYYEAVASHQARLYTRADRLLGTLDQERTGPKILDQAQKLRAQIAQLLATPPSAGTVDWYLARAAEQEAAGRPQMAVLYVDEALTVAQRVEACGRCAALQALQHRLKGATSR